ncbi:protein of unknown function [Pseudomonas mediterranea]
MYPPVANTRRGFCSPRVVLRSYWVAYEREDDHPQKSPKSRELGLLNICMVHQAGFEPTTPAFGGQYSIQLSYWCNAAP